MAKFGFNLSKGIPNLAPQDSAKETKQTTGDQGRSTSVAGVTIDDFTYPINQIIGAGFQKPTAPLNSYNKAGVLSHDEVIELFIDRTIDYKATITRCSEAELPQTIDALIAKNSTTTVVISKDFDEALLGERARTISSLDDNLTYDTLDKINTVVTTTAVAVATSGTIILDGGKGQGRRAISLIVDHHIALVYEDQIVEVLPEAISRINHRAPQTWISGPSATSDIELERVEGVHGPRKLDVIVVERG
ncbi:MAG: LUD domain-containing protein [Actinomycetota bacterium]|nr:LUD domain-containing protein [Actinomycetota bacterium]